MKQIILTLIRIKLYKWLIQWHQIRCDSWTHAVSDKKDKDTVLAWYDRYKYHNDRITVLTEKLERL